MAKPLIFHFEDREVTALAVLISLALDTAGLSDGIAEMATDLQAKLEQARPGALVDGWYAVRAEETGGTGQMPMCRRA